MSRLAAASHMSHSRGPMVARWSLAEGRRTRTGAMSGVGFLLLPALRVVRLPVGPLPIGRLAHANVNPRFGHDCGLCRAALAHALFELFRHSSCSSTQRPLVSNAYTLFCNACPRASLYSPLAPVSTITRVTCLGHPRREP